MANRYYRPSAPRYTSQFVEEQYPFDMMMGHLQMKAGQQEAFAENIGKLQAEAAIIPNGLRTEDMAPEVRRKWSDNLDSFITNNMDKYDSPQAIAELSRLRQMFQNDNDVLLMKKDAEESDLYRQIKMKSGASDIDPNVDPNGRLWQYSSGDSYSPYKPLIADPDVASRITQEFNIIKPQEITEPYIYKTTVEGQEVWKEGHRTVSKTPEVLFNQKLQNMVQRGMEGKEPWAVYENTKFNQLYGRDMNEEDWMNKIQPIAQSTLKSDYSDRANYSMPSDGKKKSSAFIDEMGLLNVDVADRPESYTDFTNTEARLLARESKNSNFRIEDNPELYNLDKAFQSDKAYTDLKTWKEKINYIRKNYVKESSKQKYDTGVRPFTPEEEVEINGLFLGKPNEKGEVNISTASTYFKGQPIYDYYNKRLLQENDKKGLVKEGKMMRILGRTHPSYIADAAMPGVIVMEEVGNKDKIYQIQIPGYAEQERPTWNLLGMRRTNSGIGQGFKMEFSANPDGSVNKPRITDVTDPRTGGDGKNIDASSASSLYFVPVMDLSDNGKYKVKVYAQNPYQYYKEQGRKDEANAIFDNNNQVFLKEYDFGDYGGEAQGVMDAIINDISKDTEDNLLYQKQAKISGK